MKSVSLEAEVGIIKNAKCGKNYDAHWWLCISDFFAMIISLTMTQRSIFPNKVMNVARISSPVGSSESIKKARTNLNSIEYEEKS